MQKNLVVSAGAILYNKNDEILLLKRAEKSSWGKGQWQLPEGKLEFGESFEQALKRELQEELGSSIDDFELIDTQVVIMHVKEQDYHVIRAIFSGEFNEKIIISEDHVDFKWIKPKLAIKDLDLIPGLKELLEKNCE